MQFLQPRAEMHWLHRDEQGKQLPELRKYPELQEHMPLSGKALYTHSWHAVSDLQIVHNGEQLTQALLEGKYPGSQEHCPLSVTVWLTQDEQPVELHSLHRPGQDTQLESVA